MDVLVQASRNGWNAFMIGRPITACPSGAIPERNAWRAGWRQARDESEAFEDDHHDEEL